MGFSRRFTFFPDIGTITQVEGVIVVDLPPPGTIAESGVGTACLVGEFADMTFAVKVDTSGNVTSNPQPVELFSTQDLLQKLGGWDETLGAFGSDLGNGFAELRNKRFSRLIAVPVNLASGKGIRLWRQLPTNISATNPTPVVQVQTGTVLAGRQFVSGSNRVRTAQQVTFANTLAYTSATDGVIAPAGLPSATQTFTSASASFTSLTNPVKVGDAIVLDVNPPTPTALSAGINALVTTIPVLSTAGFPSSGTIFIDSEAITYTTTTATTFSGGARAQLGTVAAAHLSGAAVSLLNDANTYRVNTVTSATALVLERQDGSNFTATNWLAEVAVPYRLHAANVADTGGNTVFTSTAGYLIPARPLDASISPATIITPTIVPPSLTATSADPLSGLTAATQTGVGNDLIFTSSLQAPNTASNAFMDAAYQTAIASLLFDQSPARDVNILWSARKSATIRTAIKSHVLVAAGQGVGRIGIISPSVNVLSTQTVEGASDPGVAANRTDRIIYCWPGLDSSIPEAVGFNLTTALGTTDATGLPDLGSDGWMASILSVLPPERNPGQSPDPVLTIMSPVLQLQRGFANPVTTTLTINDYIAFRSQGIAAPRRDQNGQIIFQSGITTSLTSGQKNIARRRMADFIEDSVSAAYQQFVKLPLTTALKNAVQSETVAFLNQLLSVNNPAAQRIQAFSVDIKSGNTPTLTAQGIFVVVITVQTLATADFIVLTANIGEGVTVSST